MVDDAPSVRVAEVTVAVSLATDLGTGQPMDHGLRTCWAVAWRRGRAGAGRRGAVVRVLRGAAAVHRLHVGCVGVAVVAGGDDVTFNATMAPILMASAGRAMRHFVRHLAEDLPAPRRAGRVVRALSRSGLGRRSSSGHCEVGPGSPAGSAWTIDGARARPRLRALGRQGSPRRSGRRGGAGGGPHRRRRTGCRAVRAPARLAGRTDVLGAPARPRVRPGRRRRPRR